MHDPERSIVVIGHVNGQEIMPHKVPWPYNIPPGPLDGHSEQHVF